MEFFATSALKDRRTAVETLQYLLPKVAIHPGSVVEVERVVCQWDSSGLRQLCLDDFVLIEGSEVGFESRATLPFEVHHAIEIDSLTTEPIPLEVLLEETGQLGVVAGGWFSFGRTSGWSYRSNSFWRKEDVQSRVLCECSAISECLSAKGVTCRHWAIAEQVIGIWRFPLKVI